MESLQTLMQQLERSPRWQASASFRQLLALWPELVGAAVAQHSHPDKIQRQTLQVSVSSATWAQNLTFERIRILKKIHQRIPATVSDIQEIRFNTGRWRSADASHQRLAASSVVDHPSWIATPTRQRQRPPQNAEEAFERWSTRLQSQWRHQARCPRCDRPCPSQELERWSVCAICITHQWYSPQTR